MASFLAELQRRHVYKVGAAYCVAGWLIVQVVTQVFPVYGLSADLQRIIVTVVIAGFPVALVLAWLFDFTPQGIVRTDSLPAADESVARIFAQRGMERRLNYLLGALLVLAMGYFVAERSLLRGHAITPGAAEAAEPSVAVLPLVNTSGAATDEYFSDGLSEELIAVLAKVPRLKVIGRSSSFRFKNSQEDSRAIGNALGVAHLLEGSVLKDGERVRIVTELVNAADGRELWSDTFDRDLKDVFAVQSEIAAAVAQQLKLKLLAGEAQPSSRTENLEAHNALLQGNFYAVRQTLEDLRKAVTYYDEALRADPGYATAYAQLSQAWRGLSASWLEGREVDQGYVKARAAADRALALAPDAAESHAARGGIRLTPDLDFPAAEAEFREALVLEPSGAAARNQLAYSLSAQGKFTEAEAEFRRAIDLDPLSITPRAHLARLQIALGRLDEAEAGIKKAMALQPGSYHLYVHLVLIDLLRKDVPAAVRDAEQEHEGFWRDFERALVAQAQMSDDKGAADKALQDFIAQHGETGAFQIAELYGLRQEPEHLFEWLDRAEAMHDSGLSQLLTKPYVTAYRSDARFVALCQRLKIDPGVLAQLP